MSFAIDVQALRERAATRVANVANAANRLTPNTGISQLAALAVSREPQSAQLGGSPALTRAQADRCHAPEWNDVEIQAFADRRDRLLRWGYSDQQADGLAERLTLRDREQDDRRLCAECRHGRSRRCPDGEPMPGDVLHRCGGFCEHTK